MLVRKEAHPLNKQVSSSQNEITSDIHSPGTIKKRDNQLGGPGMDNGNFQILHVREERELAHHLGEAFLHAEHTQEAGSLLLSKPQRNECTRRPAQRRFIAQYSYWEKKMEVVVYACDSQFYVSGNAQIAHQSLFQVFLQGCFQVRLTFSLVKQTALHSTGEPQSNQLKAWIEPQKTNPSQVGGRSPPASLQSSSTPSTLLGPQAAGLCRELELHYGPRWSSNLLAPYADLGLLVSVIT